MGATPHTVEDKQKAMYQLAYNEWNLSKTERELGISKSRLAAWRDEMGEEARAVLMAQVKEDLLPRLSRILDKALQRLEDEIPNLPKNILPTTCGILFDKRQILRGEPTSVTKQIAADADTLDAELKRLSDAVGQVPARAAVEA